MDMISVIIVDFGTLDRTIKYIKDFTSKFFPKEAVSFIIIDNWDQEDAEERRRRAGFSWHKQFRLMEGLEDVEVWHMNYEQISIYLLSMGCNYGYAKGNNLGAIFSQRILKIRYAIFSNNDIQFVDRFSLEQIMEVFCKYPDCFAWGPRILGLDGVPQGPVTKQDTAFDALVYPYSIFRFLLSPTAKVSVQAEFVQNVHHTVGCFLIVDLNKFGLIGMFDDHTFLYYEEDILSARGRKKGLSFYYAPQFTIIHEGGATTKKMLDFRQKNVFFQSACYYYQKYEKIPLPYIIACKINFWGVYLPLYILRQLLFKIFK